MFKKKLTAVNMSQVGHQMLLTTTTDSGTAPQHLVCRAVQSLHINHMQMSIIEVFICRRLHMNTSMIPVCIWLICRLCTALHTKCCGAVWTAHSWLFFSHFNITSQNKLCNCTVYKLCFREWRKLTLVVGGIWCRL